MEPGDTLGGRIGYQMKRAQHALRLEMDDALRGLGLTTPQYAALSVLAEGTGLSGAEVARRCFVTPQTMNGVLVKLEGAGLLSRRAHPEHGRVLQAYPTREGRDLLLRAHQAVVGIEERMLSGMERGERLRLLEALKSCADSLGAGERGRTGGEAS
ncbi:MarR family transcriptional regulator [Rubrobacter marinus]|uniref:MarR family transcriptional regulator n=1 Tax=Rubrobacter marinus TaxID=2653852 RepID=A0A6G8PSB8_9ACTN|nr:MarR family transcriptional regulator [Rubrobacter marinus]QIN77330.1 MarR family transcriptional regulator [Rubrobacter marinus]